MMGYVPQSKVAATYMRGGTSKGVFFLIEDLPVDARAPGAARDAFLMRVIGSPDPYGKQIDGMGAATSSTSKVVLIGKSSRAGHDVDYLFGQVSIDRPFIDWTGNCGNLSAAVGPFAISNGLVDWERISRNGTTTVHIWQANIGKTIVSHVPMRDGVVQELGDFSLDGAAFPAAEVRLEFIDPAADEGGMFPTGRVVDDLAVPGIGTIKATMINAGIPTIFVNAEEIGFSGTELQGAVNGDDHALAMLETIRAVGAVRMGLIAHEDQIGSRQHTPKVAFVAPPADYTSSSGTLIRAREIDLSVRAMSMGKMHHAMMGTVAVAIGAAASIEGSLVNLAAGGGVRHRVRFGHPSGSLLVGAESEHAAGEWVVKKVSVSRSARVLMEGLVHVPVSDAGS